MKATSFSVYEAKARFSEVLRIVAQTGRKVVVTKHGRPVAEIAPFSGSDETMDEMLARLEQEGLIEGPEVQRADWSAAGKSPGALERFLADRDGQKRDPH